MEKVRPRPEAEVRDRGRRLLRHERGAAPSRHRRARGERDSDQAESDRESHRDRRRDHDGAQGQVGHEHLAPFRRDGGHDDFCPRCRVRVRVHQDRVLVTVRPRGEVQQVDGDRTRNGEIAMQSPLDIGKLVRIITEKVPTKRHALPRVVFVVGTTSSGKTALGIRLVKEFGGEIINADARQIYRDLTIGTGKPAGKRTKGKGHTTYLVGCGPHFLMDFLPPDKTYSAAQWREAGHPASHTAYQATPLGELVRLLLTIDPGAAGVVDLKNKRRVIRALEVVTYTGKKFSELRTQGEPLVDAFQVGIRFEKDELFRRIDRSIDNMVEEGLIDEVRSLLRRGYKASLPSLSAIGYQDVARYLTGEITQDDAIALIKRRTHQYTKRQWTWFKRDPRIRWAKSEDEAVEMVGEWLGS